MPINDSCTIWWRCSRRTISFSKVLKVFASSPGLTIVIPSTPYDAKGLLLSSIESNDPVLSLSIKKLSFTLKEVAKNITLYLLGKADVKREGEDLAVVCYGLIVDCLQAADILAADGINVEVVDLRTVYKLIKKQLLIVLNIQVKFYL